MIAGSYLFIVAFYNIVSVYNTAKLFFILRSIPIVASTVCADKSTISYFESFHEMSKLDKLVRSLVSPFESFPFEKSLK